MLNWEQSDGQIMMVLSSKILVDLALGIGKGKGSRPGYRIWRLVVVVLFLVGFQGAFFSRLRFVLQLVCIMIFGLEQCGEFK